MKDKGEVIYLQLAVCKYIHLFEHMIRLKIKGKIALFVVKSK